MDGRAGRPRSAKILDSERSLDIGFYFAAARIALLRRNSLLLCLSRLESFQVRTVATLQLVCLCAPTLDAGNEDNAANKTDGTARCIWVDTRFASD